MKRFALIGASGFVAPRHMQAIRENDCELSAAMDPFDSAGVIDSYFPKADFFVEFERFDRHLDKMRREGKRIDFLSICSPNYLHDAHIRFGLRQGADVICEKPLVLNPWNVEALMDIERESEKRVNTILQLRLHPSIRKLKQRIIEGPKEKIYDIDLTYITSRGSWYYTSWKGDVAKSGGIATNIGIHFYDMLMYLFGKVNRTVVHVHNHDRAAGYFELERARVRWFLSINAETLPKEVADQGQRTFRSITIDGDEIEFSGGFTDLHTDSYREILSGNGYGLEAAYPSIELVHRIRSATPAGLKGDYHPFADLPLAKHPFENS